jgi:hypothetical protein
MTMGETKNGQVGGFRIPHRVLEWPEGHAWHGLRVTVRRSVIADIERYGAERVAALTPGDGDQENSLRAVAISQLLDVLIDWNLQDDNGELIPPPNLDALPPELIASIWAEWWQGIGRVSVPLSQPSSDGSRSVVTVPSMPKQEILSDHHPS